jgi:hypothetical protein
MLSRVAFVSHLVGRPLAIVAEFEPAGDATDYCGPLSCSLTVYPSGGNSVPLLDREDLWALQDEAHTLAQAQGRARFAA